MHEQLITNIIHVVEKACAAPTNSFGYGIWTHHITRVAENGKQLASLFDADTEIVEIAALLHDYASVKDYMLAAEHPLHGAIEAEKLLKQLNYPLHKIEAVKHCITAHRASIHVDRQSAEAICLANADALAHIEYVSSLFYLVYVRWHMSIDEGTTWVRAKLQRSWNKLSEKVRQLAYEQYEAALRITSS